MSSAETSKPDETSKSPAAGIAPEAATGVSADLESVKGSGAESASTNMETVKSSIPNNAEQQEISTLPPPEPSNDEKTIVIPNLTEGSSAAETKPEPNSKSSETKKSDISQPAAPEKPNRKQMAASKPNKLMPDGVTPTSPTTQLSEEGGEWELLSEKVRNWWQQNDLSNQWSRFAQPLLLVVALIVVLQAYGSILSTIAKVPLAPRIFEFVGMIWLIRFSNDRLIRSKDRKELISSLAKRWQTFRGDLENDG